MHYGNVYVASVPDGRRRYAYDRRVRQRIAVEPADSEWVAVSYARDRRKCGGEAAGAQQLCGFGAEAAVRVGERVWAIGARAQPRGRGVDLAGLLLGTHE